MKNINFQKKILLSNYTTIKVGGVAEYFAKPNNKNEFINLIKWSHLNNQECLQNILKETHHHIFGLISYLLPCLNDHF